MDNDIEYAKIIQDQEYEYELEYTRYILEQDQYQGEYLDQEQEQEQEQPHVPIVSDIQDSDIKFFAEDQSLCNDCNKNSDKDPEFPYLSLATDPSWIIMTCCDTLFLQCSHM